VPRRRKATRNCLVSSGSHAGDVAGSGRALGFLVDTHEAKTPEKGNEGVPMKAEHVADEGIVRQYG